MRGNILRAIDNSKVLLICENQLKTTIPMGWGEHPKDATYGGSAFEFYASIQLKLSQQDWKLDSESPVSGSWCNVQAVKNNVRGQGRRCSLVFKEDVGPDEAESLIQHLKKHGGKDTSFTAMRDMLGVAASGWADLRREVATNPQVLERVRGAVFGTYNPLHLG
jgi:hypothetical protein